MKKIVAAAGEAGALLLVDEAYYPFGCDTVAPLIADAAHLVVCRSAGRLGGAPGFGSVGVASPEAAFMLHKVRPMYEISTLAVHAFAAVLDLEGEMLASVRRLLAGKALFLSSMEALGLRTLKGAGNFMHVAFGPREAAVHAALADMVLLSAILRRALPARLQPLLRRHAGATGAADRGIGALVA